MYIQTGSFDVIVVDAGVQTLAKRQSSDCKAEGNRTPFPRQTVRSYRLLSMIIIYEDGSFKVFTVLASCIPVVAAGSCGARNLKFPSGGAANRIPRYWLTPELRVVPSYWE
jgi:hypothetical protein